MNEFLIIKTTFSNKDQAIELSKKLIDLKLCACAQISKVESYYSWNQEIENSEEFELKIKTKSSLLSTIEQKIKQYHNYEIPQIISYNFLPSNEYRSWLLHNLG